MEPEYQNIGYLLNKAALRLRWRLSERLEEHGVTLSQWAVLRDLASQDQLPPQERKLTPALIAARLEMDRPTLSGILDRLAGKGWVRVEANPQDRRSQLVSLTEPSKALIPRLERASGSVLEYAVGGMEDAELDMLRASLIKLIHHMDEGE